MPKHAKESSAEGFLWPAVGRKGVSMEINVLMITILQEIINENGKVEIEETLKRLNISRRTLNYNLKKINYILEKYGKDPVNVINQYMEYPKGQLDVLIEWILANEEVHRNYVLSQEERKQIIFLNVGLNKKVTTLDNLADQMNVSKNTVVNDLLSLKSTLQEKGIRLDNHAGIGYYLEGNEQIIRRTLYGEILSMMRNENNVALKQLVYGIFEDSLDMKETMSVYLQDIEEVIRRADYLKNYEINHNSVEELVQYVMLVMMRNQLGNIYDEQYNFEEVSEYHAAEKLIDELKSAGYSIEREERGYIATILLGVRRENYQEILGETSVDFRQMALDIIEKYEDYACVKFENKPWLVEQLLVHVRPMYYRLIYNVKVNNKYYREIREQSEDYYRITRLVGLFIGEKYGITITEEELAYLCIYFTSWMTKYKKNTDRYEDTILIICGAGIGTSLFVKLQIQELVGETCGIEMKDVQSAPLSDIMKYGLVITTLDLGLKNENVIRVNPLLSVRDKSHILNWLNQEKNGLANPRINNIIEIVEKYAIISDYTKLQVELQKKLQMSDQEEKEEKEIHLRDILLAQNVQLCSQKVNGSAAMRIATMPLVESGVVKISYFDVIMEAVRSKGLYFEILPGILLAHAKPDDKVSRVGIAVTVFTEGTCFKEKPDHRIHTIMVLATPSNTAHMNVLKELFQLLRNPECKSRLQTGDFSSSYELKVYLETVGES